MSTNPKLPSARELFVKFNAAEGEAHELRAGMHALRAYLQSVKFHNDPTVQTQDILNWLDRIQSRARDVRDTLDMLDLVK